MRVDLRERLWANVIGEAAMRLEEMERAIQWHARRILWWASGRARELVRDADERRQRFAKVLDKGGTLDAPRRAIIVVPLQDQFDVQRAGCDHAYCGVTKKAARQRRVIIGPRCDSNGRSGDGGQTKVVQSCRVGREVVIIPCAVPWVWRRRDGQFVERGARQRRRRRVARRWSAWHRASS